MQTKQKIHKYRSCGIQLKQCLEGNLQLLVPVLREKKTAQISNLKKLEKEEKEEARKEKNKPITNRRKKIIKTRM